MMFFSNKAEELNLSLSKRWQSNSSLSSAPCLKFNDRQREIWEQISIQSCSLLTAWVSNGLESSLWCGNENTLANKMIPSETSVESWSLPEESSVASIKTGHNRTKTKSWYHFEIITIFRCSWFIQLLCKDFGNNSLL